MTHNPKIIETYTIDGATYALRETQSTGTKTGDHFFCLINRVSDDHYCGNIRPSTAVFDETTTFIAVGWDKQSSVGGVTTKILGEFDNREDAITAVVKHDIEIYGEDEEDFLPKVRQGDADGEECDVCT